MTDAEAIERVVRRRSPESANKIADQMAGIQSSQRQSSHGQSNQGQSNQGQSRQGQSNQGQYETILQLQEQVRSITDERELAIHLCNASRDVLHFDQSFYGKVKAGKKPFSLLCAASTPSIDRTSPFTHWFEEMVARMIRQSGGLKQVVLSVPENSRLTNEMLAPGSQVLWTPLVSENRLIGGFLTSRDIPWSESEVSRAAWVAGLYVHAAAAIKGSRRLKPKGQRAKYMAVAAMLAVTLGGFLPVPISALAPVEVTPESPFVLSAPFDGVVKEIIPDQGQSVGSGDVTVIFDDVHLLNSKLLAEQQVAVAEARYQRVSQGAIADYRIKRDIEVARAEFELAQSESSYASKLYEQSRLAAPAAGVAIFSGKEDWEGQPVSAGEAIVSIADPASVNFTINLPVNDSIVLKEGAQVRVFLDSDPLRPLDAVLTEANYSASPDKRDVLSYQLKAKAIDSDMPIPRIGVQGTAQIYGERATLGYVVFRRPFSALRQLFGW